MHTGMHKITTQENKQPRLKDLSITVRRLEITTNQSVTIAPPSFKRPQTPPSPAITRSKTYSTLQQPIKRRKISGCPSQLQNEQQQCTFQVKHHVLQKQKCKVYLKCQISKCLMACTTFHSGRALNSHHQVFHYFSLPKMPEGSNNSKLIEVPQILPPTEST